MLRTIRSTIKKASNSTLDQVVSHILKSKNGNNNTTKNVKKNLNNAYKVYRPYNKQHTYRNGLLIGQKLSNALFKYVNKKSNRPSSKFSKGLKNGAIKSSVYWIPGVAARGVHGNVNRFVKRAGKLKGLENVHRLFKNETIGSIK